MHIHKWSPVYKTTEPYLASCFGWPAYSNMKFTGVERCKKCGKRQKDREDARLYSYCAVVAACGGTLLVGSAYAGPLMMAIGVTAGLALLMGAALGATLTDCTS